MSNLAKSVFNKKTIPGIVLLGIVLVSTIALIAIYANKNGDRATLSVIDSLEGDYDIGFFAVTTDDSWHSGMDIEIRSLADRYIENGVIGSFESFSAKGDTETQIRQISQFISGGDADCIIVEAVSSGNQSFIAALDRAVTSGITVICVNSVVDRVGIINILNDKGEWARMSAEWVIEQIGAKGDIFLFTGGENEPDSQWCSRVWKEVIAKYPGVVIAKEGYHNHNSVQARQQLLAFMSVTPSMSAILTQGTAGAMLSTIETAGKAYPYAIAAGNTVYYLRQWYDINYGPEAEGGMLNTIAIADSPEISATALKFAVKILNGGKVDESRLKASPYADSISNSSPGIKNCLLIPPKTVITNDTLTYYYEQTADLQDTDYLREALTDEEVAAYFTK